MTKIQKNLLDLTSIMQYANNIPNNKIKKDTLTKFDAIMREKISQLIILSSLLFS